MWWRLGGGAGWGEGSPDFIEKNKKPPPPSAVGPVHLDRTMGHFRWGSVRGGGIGCGTVVGLGGRRSESGHTPSLPSM